MRIIIVDFYDSFVYNLVHYFESMDCIVEVMEDRNIDIVNLQFLEGYAGVVLSPGPGLPKETHSMFAILEYCRGKIPVFGVCLGMQGMGLSLGGKLENQPTVRHGESRKLFLKGNSKIMDENMEGSNVGLYHSWAVVDLPEQYITSYDQDKVLMSLECNETLRYGVQFHPESILTDYGMEMVKNVKSKIFS